MQRRVSPRAGSGEAMEGAAVGTGHGDSGSKWRGSLGQVNTGETEMELESGVVSSTRRRELAMW
jgi:hypothetical protein